MPTQLEIFDFDGTLVRSPLDTHENHQMYEKAMGIPWLINKELSRQLTQKHGKFVGMRRGWFGRKETLEPPLVPDPAPDSIFITETCEALQKSKADPSTITVLMTGRHAGLKNQVLRIAGDGNLVQIHKKVSKQNEIFCECIDSNITCWFAGDNGPKPYGTKPNSTLPWKIWIIEQYLALHQDLAKIVIWEDREEHVRGFQSLNDVIEPEVVVRFVKN